MRALKVFVFAIVVGLTYGLLQLNRQQGAEYGAAQAAKDAECRLDLACWAEKRSLTAGLKCKEPIERLASYGVKWTDGALEPKMRSYKWADRSRGTVTYLGDRLQMQNAYGAWQNVVYECDYDIERNTVVDVRARPGRI